MPPVKQTVVLWWLLICSMCCFSNCSSVAEQASAEPNSQFLSTAATTQQESSNILDVLEQIDNDRLFISKKQLTKLKSRMSIIVKNMIKIEEALQDPKVERATLIDLQNKTIKKVQNVGNQINRLIKQSDLIRPKNQLAKPPENDQVDQQLESTNQRKVFQGEKDSFLSSGSSKPVSPSVFWQVDASASTNKNTSSINSGNSFLSANYSPNFNSSNSLNTSSSISSLEGNLQSKLNDTIKMIGNLPNLIGSTGVSLDNIRLVNISDKVNRFKEKSESGDMVDKADTSNSINNQPIKRKNEKHTFLFYHKCSESYVQLSSDDSLETGMDPELLSNSELTISYLEKPLENRVQVQNKNGKYLCLNRQGKPEIMGEPIDNSLCTFEIFFHKNEYVQFRSIVNTGWSLGFNKQGIPARSASQRRRKSLKTTYLNPCTLFLRQRSDKQLLQHLNNLKREQIDYKQKFREHKQQIKQIEQINNPLAQDKLIMAKIERFRKKRDKAI